MKTIFFGSTADSVLVLEALANLQPTTYNLQLSAVVTQPARPVGRKQILTPTPVENWAKEHNIPVLSFPSNPQKPWLFEHEQTVIDTLQPFKADLLISACYGQKIPIQTIRSSKLGGLNVHPSLLPKWRGADPVPWAILAGDHQTGVTVVTLEEAFDEGKIIAQKKYPITDENTSDSLRTKLFEIGATLLTDSLPAYLSQLTLFQRPLIKSQSNKNKIVRTGSSHYARRFTRDDGFIPWELIQKAMQGIDAPNNERPPLLAFDICHLSCVIKRAWRALHPWPGIWTEIQIKNGGKKRLKLIALKPSIIVQLEGKKPVPFLQFSSAYLL